MKQENKICAVIDTNVIVSALLSSNPISNPNVVINSIGSGALTPLYNKGIESEYKNVLNRKQFNFTDEQKSIFFETLKKFGKKTKATKVSNEDFPDKDDIVFYEVRMSVEDSYLITGNIKHFPKKPFIVTPAQMVAILKENHLI